MWKVLVKTPLGRLSMRECIKLLATMLVVLLGNLLIATPAQAADIGRWQDEGNSLQYRNVTFTGPLQNNNSTLQQNIPVDAKLFTARTSGSNGSFTYRIIYFEGDNFLEDTSARYIGYDANSTFTTFSNPHGRATIEIEPLRSPVARWQDDNTLVYRGVTFTGPLQNNNSTLQQVIPSDARMYTAQTQGSDGSYTYRIIYFEGDDYLSSTSAQYVGFDANSTFTTFSNPQGQTAIQVEPSSTATSSQGQTTCSQSFADGIGWIVCPVSNTLARWVDNVYRLLTSFLEVQPFRQLDPNNPNKPTGTYALWAIMRSIANVFFVIAFLAIIYSQLTSVGISNHNIKDMLPRLVIAATLVNISYWICAVAVDISNLLGHSLQAIFMDIRSTIEPGELQISWSDATAYILSAGAIGIAGFAAATGGSVASLGFILLAALLGAIISILVAFIILAARQAIITVLVLISPLAFVAFVLPNTKSLYDKWQKSFVTLLIFFPIFSMLFGGSQLAGTVIIASAGERFHIVLLGLATQVVPLIITPLIIRFSSGLLGQIANMTNNSSRGLVDRARNWATDNAEYHKSNKLAKTARHLDQPDRRWQARGIGRMGLAFDQGKRRRERAKKDNEGLLDATSERNWNRNLNEPRNSWRHRGGDREYRARYMHAHDVREQAKTHHDRLDAASSEHWQHSLRSSPGYASLREHRRQTHLAKGRADLYDKDMNAADELALKSMVNTAPQLRDIATQTGVNTKEAAAHQENIDASTEEAWANRQRTATLRDMRTRTHLTKNRAKVLDERMTAADQRSFDTLVASDPGYLNIRRAKEETIRDTKHAQFQASEVEAAGDRAYYRDFEDGTAESRLLRQQNVRIEQSKKESAAVASTLQKRADANWERVSRTDPGLQTLRLKEVEATDSHRLAELQWNTLVENIRAEGANAPELDAANSAMAESLKQMTQDVAVQESAISEAKLEQSSNLAKAYKASEAGDQSLLRRAAGVGGREGEIRAYSKAWKQLVGEVTEETETARAITSDYTRAQLKTVLFEGVDPNDSTKQATTAMRRAAMYELIQKKGNNQDANEIRDAIAKLGLMADDDGKYYEALRDTNGKLVLNDDGYPQIDYSQEVTDTDEIATRRDWTQFFDDAASKSPHSMVTYSGTDKSDARSGSLVSEMRTGFIRDALGGKFSPEKMLNADVDELKTLYFDMVDPDGYYQGLSKKQKRKVDETLESAILNLQGNENINAGIDDRNRGMMNEILGEINPDYKDGDHGYVVDENKAIIPLDKRDEVTNTKKFTAPITVDPPRPGGRIYYTNREIK